MSGKNNDPSSSCSESSSHQPSSPAGPGQQLLEGARIKAACRSGQIQGSGNLPQATAQLRSDNSDLMGPGKAECSDVPQNLGNPAATKYGTPVMSQHKPNKGLGLTKDKGSHGGLPVLNTVTITLPSGCTKTHYEMLPLFNGVHCFDLVYQFTINPFAKSQERNQTVYHHVIRNAENNMPLCLAHYRGPKISVTDLRCSGEFLSVEYLGKSEKVDIVSTMNHLLGYILEKYIANPQKMTILQRKIVVQPDGSKLISFKKRFGPEGLTSKIFAIASYKRILVQVPKGFDTSERALTIAAALVHRHSFQNLLKDVRVIDTDGSPINLWNLCTDVENIPYIADLVSDDENIEFDSDMSPLVHLRNAVIEVKARDRLQELRYLFLYSTDLNKVISVAKIPLSLFAGTQKYIFTNVEPPHKVWFYIEPVGSHETYYKINFLNLKVGEISKHDELTNTSTPLNEQLDTQQLQSESGCRYIFSSRTETKEGNTAPSAEINVCFKTCTSSLNLVGSWSLVWEIIFLSFATKALLNLPHLSSHYVTKANWSEVIQLAQQSDAVSIEQGKLQ